MRGKLKKRLFSATNALDALLTALRIAGIAGFSDRSQKETGRRSPGSPS
jgi:hypothetical protein